ncbi:uncharacterized protein LOC132197711 [Neocloeon triangulifer]|uniref:uncharacterized protein LOC132197711 n=1 Tax=Neocloeon triangulifer TaxID=2078957 RepID=UPI00286FA757|nr:uncharacterized protein LOC132197711 [Neocloeon triangulifer]
MHTSTANMTMTVEHPSHHPEDLWVFQVSAALLATCCIVGNGLMVAASLNARRICRMTSKNSLFFSQSCGLLIFSPISTLYPAKLAAFRYSPSPSAATVSVLSGSTTCLGVGSLPLVITTLAPAVHTLLLSLDLYLPLVDCLLEWQHLAAVAAFSWLLVILVALMPLLGWNSWRGLCYIPLVWTTKYSGLLSMLHILMAMACAYLLLGMFIHSRLGKESAPQDEKPSTDSTIHVLPPWEAKARLMCILVLLLCTLPMLLAVLVHSDVLTNQQPVLLQLAWLARHDSVLPWSLLLAILPAALLPLFCVAAEPYLCAALRNLGHRFSCYGLAYVRPSRHTRRHRNVVTPASEED